MKERIIEFETAKLAKEKGFKGLFPTTDYIPMYVERENGKGELSEQQGEDDERGDFYLAVTQSLLQSWLRESHNIIVVVKPIDEKDKQSSNWHRLGFGAIIYRYDKTNVLTDHSTRPLFDAVDFYKEYDEALEEGLVEGLKMIEA